MELKSLLGLLDKNRDFNRLVERLPGRVVVSSAGPLRPYLVAGLADRSERPVLVMTARPADAERFARDARAFFPKTLLLPAPETLPHEAVSPSVVGVGRTFAALHALAKKEKSLVISPVAAILRKIPGPAARMHLPIEIEVGTELDLIEVSARLSANGYRRVSLVEERGEFALRGGIIDLFPSTAEHPIRVEFFGDEVESIRSFSAGSQRTIGELEGALIYGCREVAIDSERFTSAADALAKTPWFAEEAGRLRDGFVFEGIERFTPLLFSELATPLEYLAASGILVLDSPAEIEAEAARFLDSQRANLDRAVAGGVAPALDYYAGRDALAGRDAVKLTAGPAEIAFESSAVQPVMGHLERLAGEVERLSSRGLSVVVALNDTGQMKRIGELLTSAGVEVSTNGDRSGVHLAVGEVSSGFVFEGAGVALLSYSDLFFRRREHRRGRVGARLTDLADLEVGDFAVHTAHGIARYGGLVKRSIDGMERDYMLLEYAAGDKLYVPVDQLDRVGKYIGTEGAEPNVTRLGSADWTRAKKKAKASAKKMAYDLLALYAERARASGFAFSADAPWQRELEEAFPFEETPDQLMAIDEVKRDMESERPMDRLICGDVGYGKTEVALRAAFKAVMDGRQVVVLAPTTILVQQHFETFKERFAPFPVVIEVLSRFRSPKEQKRIVEEFYEGKVDVLIGTHRLLSADVVARDLGLVIVDEEQRFGVSAKEKLKNVKKSVDVLTLSATPIPRTLQMALSGLRDLSLIETPPEDRHPVATYVGPFDERLVRDAIIREIARGGQCFFVHNHIETISKVAERVRLLVPEATIAVAHGRMAERSLERVILDFLDNRFDVLVSTTIIENGLDIPSVNTLIVDRADRLGLAQLYQLRGRVGRSDERAYAYFFYEPGALIVPQALERLRAIGEHTELGSGTKIALKDLEIRGAGNLLGAEQHGNVAAVGFELYCDLLRQAIEELGGKVHEEKLQVSVDLSLDAYLPDRYVPVERLRIEAYRKLAYAVDLSSIDMLESELVDRYGRLPEEARSLMGVARVKLRAADVGLTSVRWNQGAIILAGPKFGPEWAAAAKSIDKKVSMTAWLGRFSISRVEAGEAISFLLKLFNGIMSEFQPQE
ncbi:MAG: transcription-repair coupling factor [Actinobacteria bacterium]|nr:transcription-repair coupling factor [Actinomycetota bacterium]